MTPADGHRDPEPDQTHWPFKDEGQIRRAVKQFSQRNIKAGERRRILGRLEATGPKVAIVAEELLAVMPRQDVSTRHAILDLLLLIQRQGADLVPVAEELAKQLSHRNYGLRQKVGEILLALGPDAVHVAGRVVGLTRHSVEDVRLLSLRVLAAMGQACAEVAEPRLRQMEQGAKDGSWEMALAIRQALAAIGCTAAPVDQDQASERAGGRRRTTSRRVIRPSNRRFVEAMQETAETPRDPNEVMREVQGRLASLPPEKRARALVASLSANIPAARGMAARLLEQSGADLGPHAAEIRAAYERESDVTVRDLLADLLTMIGLNDGGR